MAVTMSVLSAITKELYQGKLREQLNNSVVGLRRIERSSAGITSEVGGKYVTFPIHYGRNSGIGARREMEDLPKAGYQPTAAARIGLKYQYGAMQLSGQALKLVDTNNQAFISALDLETDGLKNDLAFHLNREVYGDGVGNFAKLSSVTSTGANVDMGIDYISINQVVDLWKATDLAAGNALYTAVKITGYTDNGDGSGTLTWATLSGGTPANVDTLTIAGNANREWTGLKAIVNDSGTLYNVDPSSVSVWKAHVDGNSGVKYPLSEARIIRNVDKVKKAGGQTSLLLVSDGVRRSYFALLSQQRQFVGTKSFTGGFTGLAFTTDQGEIPMVSDSFAPYNTLWGLSEKNLKVYRESDWSFVEHGGSGIWKQVLGDAAGTWKDAFEAEMFQYSELGTDRRNVHFRMDDLVEAD